MVRQGVDPDLDRLRHQYDGMESLLAQTATDLFQRSPGNRHLGEIEFVPQLGYLIVVPLNPRTGQVRYNGRDDPQSTWQPVFSTESDLYFKSREMEELDCHFGDVYGDICGKHMSSQHCSRIIKWP